MKEMTELAEKAVEAAKIWDMDLDYSAESLELVEKLAQIVFRSNSSMELPENILASVANLYGAYLGEVLLRSGLKDLDYAWMDHGEDGIVIGRKDIRMDPVAKVYKRITLGPEHDLMCFFEVMFGLAVGAVDLNDTRIHMRSGEEVELR